MHLLYPPPQPPPTLLILCFQFPTLPSPPSNVVPMAKACDHHLSHLQQVKYLRKPYVLISEITKKSLHPL